MESQKSYYKQTEETDIDKTRELLNLLPDYVSTYIRSIQYNTTAKTRLEYVKDIKNFFEYICMDPQHSELTLKSISLSMLESFDKEYFEIYLDYLQKYEKNGQIYTNSLKTIKRKLASLRGLFNYLYINEKIGSCDIIKLKTPKLRKKEIVKLDADESKDFLNTIQHLNSPSRKQEEYHKKQRVRDLALIHLLLSTGMRISECIGLNLDDINFKDSSLKIIRKGNKEDIIYFSDEASAYLSEYIEERMQMKGIMEGHEDAVFLSSQKRRMSVRSAEILVKKYSQIAVPLKNITPHKLRSTFATNLYAETGDIYLVGNVLGHSDINTTRVYADLSNYQKRQARNKVNYDE